MSEIYKFEKWLKSVADLKLKIGVKSHRTIKVYVNWIKHFDEFLKEQGKSLNYFTPYDVLQFILYLRKYKFITRKIGYFENKKFKCIDIVTFKEKRDDELSSSTQNVVIAAIRKFIEFKASQGDEYFKKLKREIKEGEVVELHFTDVVYKTTEKTVLSIDEIEKLLKVFADSPEKYAGIVLLFWFGWRAGEATVKLYEAWKGNNNSYVDFEKLRIKFETEKRKDPNRWRVLPFPEELEDEVKIWCRHIQKKVEIDKISTEMLHHLLKEYIRRRSLKVEKSIRKRISPRSARYTFATLMTGILAPDLLDYWLGHRTEGSKVYYIEPEKVCEEKLRKIVIDEKKHYLFEVI